jgi:hypothetical protein
LEETPLNWIPVDKEKLPCHVGQYPELHLVWQAVQDLSDVNAIYPHPLLPDRVLAATNRGLQISEDAGRTWKALPEASAEKIGRITGIAFAPGHTDLFYLASKTKGVWATSDNGATFGQIGSKANGMAGDSSQTIEIHASDPSGRTLLVCHGDTAGGLSRSVDGGQTWGVLHKDFMFYRTFTAAVGSEGIYFVAAKATEPDAQILYATPSIGEPWQELCRDAICTDFATPLVGEKAVLVSTADRGILRISRNGGIVNNIAPPDATNWVSVGVAFGPTADSQVVYALEPTRMGLACWIGLPTTATTTAADLREADPTSGRYVTQSRGLQLNGIVREGAHARANSSGTVYYACINGMVYRAQQAGQGPRLLEVKVQPPNRTFNPAAECDSLAKVQDGLKAFLRDPETTRAAGDLVKALQQDDGVQRRIIVTARLDPNNDKSRAVTVDLSRLGGPARYQLFPEKQGGSSFSNSFAVNLLKLQKWNEWRRSWPGQLGLTVTAVTQSGNLAGAVAPLAIDNASDGLPFWSEVELPNVMTETGKVKAGGRASFARNGHRMVSFTVEVPGPWRVRMQTYRRKLDISGFTALAIDIQTREESSDDVFVQLRDQPVYAVPSSSSAVGILNAGLIPEGKFTPAVHRVIVPLKPMISGVEGFAVTSVGSVVLSGTATRPTQYIIDEMLFCSPPDLASTASDEVRQ